MYKTIFTNNSYVQKELEGTRHLPWKEEERRDFKADVYMFGLDPHLFENTYYHPRFFVKEKFEYQSIFNTEMMKGNRPILDDMISKNKNVYVNHVWDDEDAETLWWKYNRDSELFVEIDYIPHTDDDEDNVLILTGTEDIPMSIYFEIHDFVMNNC